MMDEISSPAGSAEADVAPRRNLADAFEQNPRELIQQRLIQPAATPQDDSDRVREAVKMVVETGITVEAAARQLGIAPASIHQWRKRYFAFLESHGGIEQPRHEEAAAAFSQAVQARFTDNWERLLEETHATSRDFRQDPLEVFLQTSSLTRWFFDDNGRLERGSLIGFFIALIGIIGVFVFLMTDRGTPAAVRHFSGDEAPPPPSRMDLEVMRAGEVVGEFLRADGWIRKSSYLRDSAAATPLLQEYYRTHSDKPITDGVLRHGMTGHGIVSVHYEIPSLKKDLFFNLVQDGKTYKIDWRSSTLYQAEHMEKFIAKKSTTPTILHVRVSRGNYYNYQWSDSQKYQCFELEYPLVDRRLFAYAAQDSEAGVELRLLTSLEETHAAVLEVRYPEGAKEDRQVEIVRFLSGEWLPAVE